MLRTMRNALYLVNLIVALATFLIIHWVIELHEKAVNSDILTQLESNAPLKQLPLI